jgi:hypothetical protein
MGLFDAPKPAPTLSQPQSIVRRAINSGLGGLASLGNFLDVPGSMVRDVVSGNNPFDQILSPFSAENRTRGIDLIGASDDTWGGMLGGMATEVALDPLTYLSLGTSAAYTQGGKAVKALGMLEHAPTVAAAARHSLSPLTPIAAKASSSGGLLGAVKKAAADFGAGIGPRVAKRTVTLNQMVDRAGELGMHELPARFASSVPSTPAKQRVLDALDRYAKLNGFADGGAFLAKHGDEPLAKSARIGLPFTEGHVFDIPQADKLAAAFDAVGALVGASLPARAVKSLFHYPAWGFLSKQGQDLGAAATSLTLPSAHRAAMWGLESTAEMHDLSEQFLNMFKGTTMNAPEAGGAAKYLVDSEQSARQAVDHLANWIRETAATHDDVSKITPSLTAAAMKGRMGIDVAANPDHQRFAQKLTEATQKFSQAFIDVKKDLGDRGIDIGTIGNDVFSYWPRFHEPVRSLREFGKRLFPSSFAGAKSRSVELANIPRDVIEELVSNPEFREDKTRSVAQVAASIISKFSDFLDEGYKLPAGIPPTTASKATAVVQHATDLANWTQRQSNDYLKGMGTRFYPNSPVEDAIGHLNSATRVTRTADAVFSTILQDAVDLAGPGTQKVSDTLRRAGYDPEKAIEFMSRSSGLDPAGQLTLRHTLADKYVSDELHDAIVAISNKTMNKEEAGLFSTMWDGATTFLKENLTLPFPAFHLRNLGSGQAINMMSGEIRHPRDYRAYLGFLRDAHEIRRNPAKYTELLREMNAAGVYRYGYNPADIATAMTSHHLAPPPIHSLTDVRAAVSARQVEKRASGDLLSQRIGTDPASRTTRAIDATQEGYETAFEFGKRTAATMEWYNRVPMYLYLRDHLGWAPEVAAEKVAQLQVDYSKLAPFEKEYMRKVVPFYTFTRAQLGQLGERLMESQGGLPFQSTAGTIRAMNALRGPDELVPDYVAETTSIPIPGQAEDGSKNYITGLGMAYEDPLSFFGKGLRGMGLEALSRTNPLIKAPLEYSTGEMFFQAGPMGGRDLPDADPLLGRALSNVLGRENPVKLPELLEVGLANSPASRYLSTLRQAADPRKSLAVKASNLGTGVRIATVSEGSRDAILREQVAADLRALGGKQFVRSYVPESAKSGMSPEELEQSTRLAGTMNELAKRAKARKARKAKELAEAAPKT